MAAGSEPPSEPVRGGGGEGRGKGKERGQPTVAQQSVASSLFTVSEDAKLLVALVLRFARSSAFSAKGQRSNH